MSCIVLPEQAFTILAKEVITYTQPWEVYLLISNQISRLMSLSLIVLGSADRGMNVSLEVIIILFVPMSWNGIAWLKRKKKKKTDCLILIFQPVMPACLHAQRSSLFPSKKAGFYLVLWNMNLESGRGVWNICSCFYILFYSKYH